MHKVSKFGTYRAPVTQKVFPFGKFSVPVQPSEFIQCDLRVDGSEGRTTLLEDRPKDTASNQRPLPKLVAACSVDNPRKGKQDIEDLRLSKEGSSGGWWQRVLPSAFSSWPGCHERVRG